MTNPMLAELDAQAKWLRQAASEIAKEGHAGWGNTCTQAAECIERNHATLADMAKRLEAAERDAGKCWALHFLGPDDVVAAPSREAAEIAARNFNAFWDAHKAERGHDVRVVAEVIEWEHGCIEHAKSVAQHWPEYADLVRDTAMRAGEGEG